MPRLPKRVEKLERAGGPPGPPLIVHADPGQDPADAVAAYERKNGPIPPGAGVIVICHTFKSAI